MAYNALKSIDLTNFVSILMCVCVCVCVRVCFYLFIDFQHAPLHINTTCCSVKYSLYCYIYLPCTFVQALRLCTGRTVHRGSRGIALIFLDHGTRRGERST